jgi:hypothetical protein
MAILQNRMVKNPITRKPDAEAAKQAAAPLVPATNAQKPRTQGPPAGAHAFEPRPVNNPINNSSGIPAGGLGAGALPGAGGGSANRGNFLGSSRGNRGQSSSVPAEVPTQYVDQTSGGSDEDGQERVSNEQMYDDAMRQLIGNGPRNTAEEERLLREQMQRDVGAGQANLNARMAAGGMGTSGALSALGTDMRSQAAFEAANAIQGVRSDARDEWQQNVTAGLGLMNQDRNLDVQEAKYQQYLDMINEMFGPQDAEGDGGTDTDGDGRNDHWGYDSNDPEQVARAKQYGQSLENYNGDPSTLPVKQPGPNDKQIGGGEDRNGNPVPVLYVDSNGNLFRAQ